MMGPENDGYQEAHLYASREEMESLVLDDSLTAKSYNNYRSALTTLSDSHHPLSPPITATPAVTDPLRGPSPISTTNYIYIEPPSYADVVFNPVRANNGVEQLIVGDRNPSEESEKSQEFLKVMVSNPQKEVESSNSIVPGGNNYITYLITTATNLPEFGGLEFRVRRRFRDVVTLADQLSDSYRGFFVPARPDKSVVESQVMQKQEFVEQRRVALEKYLRRLAAHPVIRRSDELRVFLQVQGSMLDGAAKLPRQLVGDSVTQEIEQPAKGGRDLLRIFKELRQSMANGWGGSRPPVEDEDKEFVEKKEKLHHLEQQLSNASQQAESLVKAQQDMGETMGELGLTFIKLTKFENEEAVFNTQRIRAADMKNVATATVKASRLYRELNAQTVKHLDTLHEYMGLMLAVHTAFTDRSNALLTVQTLLSELSSLQSKVEKLEAASSRTFGGDKSRIRKIEELKETMRITEHAKNCAVREFEQIKENNRNEIERLDRERKAKFLNMLKGFVVNQVAYTEKIGNEWAKVAEETSGYARERD